MEETGKVVYPFEALIAQFKRSSNAIKKANAEHPDPVSIEKNYILQFNKEMDRLTMTIYYYDGNGEHQSHTSVIEI